MRCRVSLAFGEEDVMTRDELEQTVQQMIAQEADIPIEAIEPHLSLVDLGVDSLDVLKLAVAFEQRFDITITTAELTRIRTLADIVDELQHKVPVS
jgi:acyl carrier protein